MNNFLNGFADELVKTSGVMGALGRAAVKRPTLALGGIMIPAATGIAAVQGYRSGRSGAKQRMLAAGPDATGKIRPTRVAYTNPHHLFEHKPTGKQKRKSSKNYKRKAFA